MFFTCSNLTLGQTSAMVQICPCSDLTLCREEGILSVSEHLVRYTYAFRWQTSALVHICPFSDLTLRKKEWVTLKKLHLGVCLEPHLELHLEEVAGSLIEEIVWCSSFCPSMSPEIPSPRRILDGNGSWNFTWNFSG